MYFLTRFSPLKWLLLLYLLVATPGFACSPAFVRGGAAHLRINLGNLVVPANALVGSPVYSKTFAWDAVSDVGSQWLSCDNSHPARHQFILRSFMSAIAATPTIYQTSVPGIGIRFSMRAVSGYDGFPDAWTSSPFNETVRWLAGPGLQTEDVFKMDPFRLKIEIVKTTPTVMPGNLEYHNEHFLLADKTALAAMTVRGAISVGGCTLDSATRTMVKLPAANLDRFGHVGKTTGDTPFALRLDCNSAVHVTLRVDGNEAPTTREQGVLINDAANNRAKGVGIQLLYQHLPLKLHQEMQMGVATEGLYAIPLSARYYQTRAHVTAGRVTSVATYTLAYY
ncbi:fimbrial protein [Raoultella terrigena]|uniref:fimbrial protein n=1 Tax=Raoultella terrigena TaxID=577 RepID=UPI000975A546|nr:fimbrial protein [Raoultella terrigena]OMP91467.1 fimbrial protein [Raoultella terrigena]